MIDFNEKFNSYISDFNSFLEDEINENRFCGRLNPGALKMLEAMSYSLKNGGKRIRPVLSMEFCRLCGGDCKNSLHFALALEMVHTYSLIHDDLPCMDDDDMRRGKPSNHVVFGYAKALLAGDGLLTIAFEEITKSGCSPDKCIEAVRILSEAAGFSGMIAGQVMDLDNEKNPVDIERLKATDELKTGKMIIAASLLGCTAAGADEKMKKAARIYSGNVGLAFQIVDDILDVTSTDEELGKPVGSDSKNNKSTYVSFLGLENAKKYASDLTDIAAESLGIFGDESEFLCLLAKKLCNRNK